MWQVLQAVARQQHYHAHTFRPARQLERTRLCHAILYPSSCPHLTPPTTNMTSSVTEQDVCVRAYELDSQYVSRQRGKFALYQYRRYIFPADKEDELLSHYRVLV